MKMLIVLLMVLPLTAYNQQLENQINGLVAKYYQNKEFSGVVLVAKKGKVLFEKAWGYADLEKGVLNELDTRFLIGSTTKSFTAVSIMQLVDQGKLNLEVPVGQYLPSLKKELGEKLTLHHLLKMSSGLPSHLNRIAKMEYSDLTEDELVKIINRCNLDFDPGTSYQYSNLNYQLAAAIVAKVSGQDFKTVLTSQTLLPLKMTASGLERTEDVILKRASGYEVKDGQLSRATRNYMGYALGSGDMYATARDLLKWDQALYGNSYLSEKSKQLLFDGDPNKYGGYGYGFKVKPYDRPGFLKGKLVRHGGSMQGFVCNVHRYLDDQLTIIVLGNIRPYPIMEITIAIEKIVLSGE